MTAKNVCWLLRDVIYHRVPALLPLARPKNLQPGTFLELQVHGFRVPPKFVCCMDACYANWLLGSIAAKEKLLYNNGKPVLDDLFIQNKK